VQVTVTENASRSRYEAVLDGRVVGFAAYRLRDGVVVLTHTEVEPDHEGAGIGSRLARAALDGARARGSGVIAECPFISAYLQRHPEYADLAAPTS
jgi:hypothetical protein